MDHWTRSEIKRYAENARSRPCQMIVEPGPILELIEQLEAAEREREEQFRQGFWWGFERARCHPEQINIRSEYEDVKELRSRNKEQP